MDSRAAVFVLLAAVVGAAIYPQLTGKGKADERATAHLQSDTAGVVARAALASQARNFQEPSAAVKDSPGAEKPAPAAEKQVAEPKPAAKPKPRVLIASPTWHCPFCIRQKEQADLLAGRGWLVGKADTDDFQYVTLGDREAREKYGITRWPTTIYLDAAGRVVKSAVGVQNTSTLETEIKALRR